MRKMFLTACLFAMALVSYAQDFTVKGKIEGIDKSVNITLSYGGKELTQVSGDGAFSFKENYIPVDAILKVTPHHPTLAMTDTAYWSWAMTQTHLVGVKDFFLEGDVSITGTVQEMTVQGINQEMYQAFHAKERALEKAQDSLRGMGRSNKGNDSEDDDTETEPVEREPSAAEKQLLKQVNELRLQFVAQHPDSYFSLNLASEQSSGDVATFNRMLGLLSERMRKTTRYAGLKKMSDGFAMRKVGNRAKGFTLKTAGGTPVSLSSYKGKYVLIDFWASWCGPCRAENPNVVRAYKQFKDKNFEVLSISVDADKVAWLKAVREDGLPWTQVIDLKGGHSTAMAYAVTGIPDNVLVDPKGTIIATNLRGKSLQAALSKFLK
ncbi:peroxiredoxin family protein [Chitinophaga sp. 22321]|uniref:TlpA family protein disulfide reductase n=1 Tax=Chitinophaga hostae TaxID=2831022 RepID=A0ABS5J4R3_9BACT|nr:TlpA disulfide reductase family protein [Chitinophaga hostae]MBS0030218.1 TlpA family protein disulfide reductase [Chitinophaga hostae]